MTLQSSWVGRLNDANLSDSTVDVRFGTTAGMMLILTLNTTAQRFLRILLVFAILLIVKVTLSIVSGYRDYFPPNFNADFLLGRERYFWGSYAIAFYVHLLSGPPALVLGLILLSPQFRNSFPGWHRRLGRVQVLNVLFLVAPSGLGMAYYALTGRIAAVGLGLLAIATAGCVACGWRAAVHRNFASHQRWMTRTFVLLSSAVVIRISGGLATVAGWDEPWVYTCSAWLSWLIPLAVYEVGCRYVRVVKFTR